MDEEALIDEIADVLNRHNADVAATTPDYLLATHLVGCLNSYIATREATRRRQR